MDVLILYQKIAFTSFYKHWSFDISRKKHQIKTSVSPKYQTFHIADIVFECALTEVGDTGRIVFLAPHFTFYNQFTLKHFTSRPAKK